MIIQEDVEKIACRIRYGSYEFVVMPFDLCNAPATFTTLMNSIFYKESDEFVVVYIDDILVFSKSEQEHQRHLWTLLTKLSKNQLYVNQEKSVFYLEELEFFRYIISKEGIKSDLRKF